MQALLQKNLDDSTRVFQLRMRAIKVDNVSSAPLSGLFIRVTVGGDYEEVEMPGKGLVKRGRAGQSLRTTPISKLEVGVPTYFKDRGGRLEEFGSFIPIYWIGSYEELEMQDFAIEVRTKSMLREKKVGELEASIASCQTAATGSSSSTMSAGHCCSTNSLA